MALQNFEISQKNKKRKGHSIIYYHANHKLFMWTTTFYAIAYTKLDGVYLLHAIVSIYFVNNFCGNKSDYKPKQ